VGLIALAGSGSAWRVDEPSDHADHGVHDHDHCIVDAAAAADGDHDQKFRPVTAPGFFKPSSISFK
jgi:hypothetical protein